jgi:hypothetical protein
MPSAARNTVSEDAGIGDDLAPRQGRKSQAVQWAHY